MKKIFALNGLTSGGFIENPATFFSKKAFGLLTLMLCIFSVVGNAQVYNYSNGFETGVSTHNWADATQVGSGTSGITSSTGSFHAQIPTTPGGAFTRFGNTTGGAYHMVFPSNGYKTSLDIYLNVSGGFTNDTRVDYSSAVNNTGGTHRRDFVFNIGFYNDNVAPGTGNRFVIGTSTGAPGNPRTSPSPIAISTSGWYRFEHSFRNNGSGVLAVDLTIYNGATSLGTWTLTDASDVIGSNVGGARYGWVLNNAFDPLAVDNSTLTINCAPFTVTTSTTPNCPSQSNGTATVTSVSSAATPYTYLWNTSPVQTTQTATGLAAGNYAVTVTDANGCTGTQSATVGTGSAPFFTTDLSQSNAVCAGNNITYNVAAAGTGPLSFQWFKDGVPLSSSSHTVITSTGTTSSLTINTIVPGDAGNYTVTVTGACAPPAMSGQGALTVYTKPVFTACPGNINTTTSADAPPSNCTAAVNYTATATSTAYPASGGTAPLTFNYSYSFSNATTASGSGTGTGSVFTKGTTNVVVTATNTCGSTTCAFNVVVADDEAPVITCTSNKAVAVNAGTCTFTKTGTDWNATATDNCTVTGYTYTLSGATTGTGSSLNNVVFNQGTTTVTFTATDGTNTSAPCSFNVLVTDNIAPMITCPGNITVNNTPGQCGAVVNFTGTNAATATDNCTGTITITYSPASGSAFPVGTTTVTATATDASSNSAQCTFTVTVNNAGAFYVNDNSTTGDVYTTANGSDATGNGTKCAPFATVQQAITAAQVGDSVYVDAGNYATNATVTINKQLNIVGANASINPITGTRVAESVIDFTANPSGLHFNITAPGVVVFNGFEMQDNLNFSSGERNVISVNSTAAHRIKNNRFVRNATGANGSSPHAIITYGNSNAVIDSNFFTGSSTGLFTNTSWRRGIYVTGGNTPVTITNNKFRYVRSHINLDFNSNAVIAGNDFQLDATGTVALSLGGASGFTGTYVLGANKFSGQGTYINLSDVSPGFILDATTSTDNGTPFSSLSLVDQFTLETKFINGNSAGKNGLVRTKPGNVYVVVSSPYHVKKGQVQSAIDLSVANDIVNVADGVYNGDVNINKSVTVRGQSRAAIIRGLYAGNTKTVVVNASNVTVKNVTITRDFGVSFNSNPNNDWASSLKTEGLAAENVGGLVLDSITVRDNRNGILLNNVPGFVVRNSIVRDNRTGFQVFGNLSNGTILNNFITNNFTHGFLINFDQGQTTATNLVVTNNNISGNWYSQINFQNTNAQGNNVGSFTSSNCNCNWYGTVNPDYAAVNAGGMPYPNQVPSQFGGTDPGVNADIRGKEAALITYSPFSVNGTDSNAPDSLNGFQPVTGSCNGSPIVITSTVPAPQTCAATGSITVTFSNGMPPYTVSTTGPVPSSASTNTSPYTISNLTAGTYNITITDANGTFATTSAVVTYNPVTNTNTGISYTTIQGAIDAAATTNGHTLQVCAGRYAESITVSKPLSILGPNASVIPCSGTRVAEAVILPVASQPFYDFSGGTEVKMMQITANNVTIKGLVFDGDNAAIGGGTASDTADINAADGIDVFADVQNITIQNNIFKNLNETGVQALPSGSVTLQNNIISNNQFVNIAGNFDAAYQFSGYGLGVLVYNNFYATVDNNCMTNVRIGVQTGNYNLAGSPASISNNVIESKAIGVWYNLHYQSASNWTVTGNNLTTRAGATKNTGVFVSSIQSGVSGTITNNNVTGAKWGVELWNNPTTNPITVNGGTLTNCETGVFANNFDSYDSDGATSNYTVSGMNITSNVANNIGIHVKDNSANTNGATTTIAVQNSTIASTAAASTGLLVTGGGAFASFTGTGTPAAFTGQAKYITLMGNGTDAPATGINATAVMFGGQTGAMASPAQNFVIEDKIDHKIDSLPLGFVTVRAGNAFVNDIAPLAPTATNNDYTRVRNGILAASNGFTINHDGNFNWAETNAATSWAAGNDGVSGNGDDYRILVPANLNTITFTTPASVTPATIQGPGDVATVNLESVLRFNGAGLNQGWTISNMKFQDFDLSIGMFSGAGGIDAYDNTTITNNTFRIPRDLNATVASADVNQNIGIHFSFGSNQTIANNTFEVDGTGVSDGTNNYSSSNVMQSNTSGGATAYDGLKIINNTITITGVPATSPNQSVIRGIWENSQSTGAAIEISGNKFSNAAAGNTAILNRQTAFWVTSSSDATKKVEYKNNEVSGFRDGIAWLGGLFTGNMPPDYNTGETPTEIMNNKFDGVQFGVVVRKSGASNNPGSPAIANNNSFTNTPTASGGYAISNEASGTTNATCNWYGSNDLGIVAPKIQGAVMYMPYLNDGTDTQPATVGFQPAAGTCVSPTKLYVNDGSPTGDSYTTATGNDATGNGSTIAPFATIAKALTIATTTDTIFVDAGSYFEEVVVNKEVTIKGLDSAKTIVYPATSNPVGSGGTLGGNTIFLVQANNVTIRDFTIDGNNPNIGVAVDARNGIVTDFNSGDFTNLTVHHITVKNVYFRGIYSAYSSTPGQRFNFHHNTVTNVRGDANGSIGIFNFGNSGIIDSNKVTNSLDGIAANQSTGTIFSNNTTTGSGIHTDNNGGSDGIADTLRRNTVSSVGTSGYGILVFLPSRNVIVEENTINSSYIAIANVGQGATGVTPVFRRNTIDGQNVPNSTGIFQTTSIPGFSPSNVSGTYLNNFIRNNQQGFYLKHEGGFASVIEAHENSITGNPTSVAIAVGPDGAGTLTNSFTCNWFGGANPVVTGGTLNAQPTLINGTDNEPTTPGFQPVPGSCGNCVMPDVVKPTITLKPNPTVFLTSNSTYTIQLSDVLQSVTDNCDPNPSANVNTLTVNCSNVGANGNVTTYQPFIANSATGNQNAAGEQGMDFRVNAASGIVITQLGAFDHQANGLLGTQPDGNGGFGIRVAIFNKANQSIVPGLDAVITGNGDAFSGNYRYKNIPAVTLPPGDYLVLAKGYNVNELNGNSYNGGGPYPQGDNAGGAISFLNTVFYDEGDAVPGFTYPSTMVNTGTSSVLKSGTFTYALNQGNTVTVTASDASGNQSVVTATVTVMDTMNVLITKNITVNLNSSGQATIQPADVLQSFKNKCGIDVTNSTLQVSPSSFNCSNVGASTLSAPYQPFIANSATGNQNAAGEQGMDFRVNAASGIVITQLGAFDHQANGLLGTQPDGNGGFGIRVAIFNKANQSIVPGLDAVITGNGDAFSGNYRYKNIPAVTLPPGDYLVLAKGYNVNELNGNSYNGGGPYPQGDNAGGAISFLNTVFYDEGDAVPGFTYPSTMVNTGTSSVLKSGTFTYSTRMSSGTPVTLTATDMYGNQKQATASVTVVDNNGPVITTKNITIALNNTGNATITPNDVLQSPITDNCGVNTASISVSPSSFSCADYSSNGGSATTYQPFIANSATGNQNAAGEQGMDFRVNAPNGIVITQLGAFDHQGDGIMGTGIRVAIFNKSTQSIVSGLDAVIVGNGDAFAGNYRYKNIPAVTLPPGDYVVLAKGYNANELSGNSYLGGGPYPQGDNAGGAISYLNTVFYDENDVVPGFTYPSTSFNTGTSSVLKSGTFTYALPVSNNKIVTVTATDVNGNISQQTAVVTLTDPNNSCTAAPKIAYATKSDKADVPVAQDNVTMTYKVYPNPSTGQFTVQLLNVKVPKVTLQVMDVNGKIVEQKVVMQLSKMTTLSIPVDISRQAPGMYIVKLISANGVQTTKVVVSR